MGKTRLLSLALPIIAFPLAVIIYNNYYNPYNNYYNPYNQVPPYNQNYYDVTTVPVYPNRTEAEKNLTSAVEAALREDPFLSNYASQIQVYTVNQEVTLSGIVDSDRIRLNAESKAKSVLGVKKVVNLINVQKTR